MAKLVPYNDESPMPFGVHRGQALANVPGSYLLWLWNKSNEGKTLSDPRLKAYIKDNLDVIKKNPD